MDTTPAPAAAAPAAPANSPEKGEPQGSQVPPAAAVTQAPAKPGLSAVISAVLTSAREKFNVTAELASARQQISTLTTERDAARAEATAANTARDEARAQLEAHGKRLAAIGAFFGVTQAELASADEATCASLLKAKIDTAAIDAVASMGVDAAQLPKAAQEPKEDPKDLVKQADEIADPEARAAFIKANRAKIHA